MLGWSIFEGLVGRPGLILLVPEVGGRVLLVKAKEGEVSLRGGGIYADIRGWFFGLVLLKHIIAKM